MEWDGGESPRGRETTRSALPTTDDGMAEGWGEEGRESAADAGPRQPKRCRCSAR